LLDKKKSIPNFYQFDNDFTLSMANFAQLNNQVMTKKVVEFPFLKAIEQESNFNLAPDLQITQVFNSYFSQKKLPALEQLQNLLSADTTESSRYKQLLFNTLLKKTQEEVNSETADIPNKLAALALIDKFPLDINILQKSTAFLNQTGSTKEAYAAILNAKKWRPESTEILKLYILQCFKIHMLPYAQDGLNQLKNINQVAYNNFLPVYQAQMALVEKANAGFE
jgi:hypothetical protein